MAAAAVEEARLNIMLSWPFYKLFRALDFGTLKNGIIHSLFVFYQIIPVVVGAAVAACEGEGGQAGLGAGCAAGTAAG